MTPCTEGRIAINHVGIQSIAQSGRFGFGPVIKLLTLVDIVFNDDRTIEDDVCDDERCVVDNRLVCDGTVRWLAGQWSKRLAAV